MDEPTPLDASPASPLQDKMIAALRTCYDPEIPVNIYDLGLIYEAKVDTSGHALVKMTLTAPGCPASGWLAGEVEDKINALPGIKSVKVNVVWEPRWSMEMMSEAARLQLGLL
jgi:FeS assembly SUF system protein